MVTEFKASLHCSLSLCTLHITTQ